MWKRSVASVGRSQIPGVGGFALTDEALMDRLAFGDSEALDEIIRRHWDVVLDYSVRTINSADFAEDLAQEAFIALWEGRKQWERGSRPRPLLLRIIRNRSLNESRRKAVRTRLEEKVRSIETARRTPNPLQELETKELESAFRKAFEALSPRKREVFELARFQGLAYAEIAEVLGTSPQTVANQMSAALQQLRQELRSFDLEHTDSSI